MTNEKEKEKVVRAFDYSRFNNIDISDDEDTFHPNIEKNFNIKINKQVRDRKIGEMEHEKETLADKQDAKSKKRLEELERKKIWHAGNMCSTKDEKTLISSYGSSDPKRDILPGKDEGMQSDKDLEDYMRWKSSNQLLLDELVSAGGNMDKTQQLLEKKGDLLVDVPHAATYLLLSCLEYEMDGNAKKMYKCAQQSQLLTHIKALAESFGRPPRDIVHRWFEKIADNAEALKIWQADVDGFAQRVRERAVQKRIEQKEEEKEKKTKEENYVAAHWRKPEDVKDLGSDEELETGEAVPLVQAMKEMTKEQRMEMAPGGLDPLEVFEGLPVEMRECFESQDIPRLIGLQKTMPPEEFNPAIIRCIKAGLWTQPMDDDDDEAAMAEAEAEAQVQAQGEAAAVEQMAAEKTEEEDEIGVEVLEEK